MSGSYTSLLSQKVLSDGALQVLITRGESPVLRDGFRTVSNTSYMSEDSADSATTVQIPDQIDSLEAIKFLQFNDNAAKIIWQQYLEDVSTEPDRADLFYCARSYVRGTAGDALYYEDDWIGVMQRIGVASLFQ
jgi:hypothetical protein